MKKIYVSAVILLTAAAVCSASGFELLQSMAGDFNAAAPVDPAVSSDNRVHAPFYSELPGILLSEPIYTSSGTRIWLFSSLHGYKSKVEAALVMTFWKTAIEKGGIKVASSTVVSTTGSFYDFEILFAGDKYISLYESSENLYNTEEEANSSLAAQISLIKQHGLTVIAAMSAQYQGKYAPIIYYTVAYTTAPANRYRICDYQTNVLYDSETAAVEQARLDKKAFERAGVAVIDTGIMSGPNGALYFIHYIGKTTYPQFHSEGDFETADKANAAMSEFMRKLEQSAATVLEAKVYPSGPWFADRYSFDVRYIRKN